MTDEHLKTDLCGLFHEDEPEGPSVERTESMLESELSPFVFAGPSHASVMPFVSIEPMSGAESRRPKMQEEMLQPGAIIDKYRIEELIGVGGFGTVYRATHLLLGTAVALKMLKPSVLKARPHLAERLCVEAKLAAQIEHPGVVRILDVTHNNSITYVVMEYIDGATLSDTLAMRGPLPIAAALQLALDVVAGLSAGLKRGVIHRDVKPANILVTTSGRAKLVDFGLAIATSLRESRGPAGTPGYMAPETGDDIDHRADIYSLGITLYQAVTGVAPQKGPNQSPLTIQVNQLRPEVAGKFSALIKSMTAVDKKLRPASYDELTAALETLSRVVA